MSGKLCGYTGSLLRVDLTTGRTQKEDLDEATLRKYIGGTGLGIKLLYEEVQPGTKWSDPENRLILAAGPLGGTRIGGSGSFSVVTKGPLTNGATSVQANGFFGAFLKFCGFDGIILQGASRKWVYIYIDNEIVELKEASHLVGKDTFTTEDLIKQELGKGERQISVAAIGPAGENLVKFAGIFADKGHSASHNGPGAVLGAKKLKAIAVARGRSPVTTKDKERVAAVANELLEGAKKYPNFKWGTLPFVVINKELGVLPIRNYTTNVWAIEKDELAKFDEEHIRDRFKPKPSPCWACQHRHCHMMTITEGPYAGLVVEEPEYEQLAAWAPNIGQTDIASAMMLSHETDRLGLENNEAGWVISWVMECYEKGILTRKDTRGLEMTWGNVEAAKKMLNIIATREGPGDVLGEGVMRASQHFGEQASNLAIYTKKGNTPRGHDHRTRWYEMFDTCISDTGTIETSGVRELAAIGLPSAQSAAEVSTLIARNRGVTLFEDSLVVCTFNSRTNIQLLSEAVSAVTGWDFTSEEAMTAGLRIANLLRAFNTRHGLTPDLEYPSHRYGSTPVDGPTKGKGVMPFWEQMLGNYYSLMGWDRATGKPLPDTLRILGLEHVIKDLWLGG